MNTTSSKPLSFNEISGNTWRSMNHSSRLNEEEPNLCGEFENKFDTRGINYQSLVEDIRLNINSLKGFYFDYTRYALEDSVTTSFQGSMGTPVISTFQNNKPFDYKDETGKNKKGVFESGRLNQRICYVSEYNVGVNFDGKNVHYIIDFIYEGAENAFTPIESTSENDFVRNDKYKAITLSDRKIETFLGIINTIYGSRNVQACKNVIAIRYQNFFRKYNNDADTLKLLYEQAPDYAVLKDDAILMEHLKLLMEYDDVGILSGWNDSSNAIIKILKNISNKQDLYNWLYKNPATVLRLYRNLDGENQDDFFGIKISNKEFYCMILSALSDTYALQKEPVGNFTIGKSFKVDSDIDDQGVLSVINPLNWFSDPKKQLFLQQQKEVTTSHYSYGRGGVRALSKDTSTIDIEEGKYFHPLEIVTLFDEESGDSQLVPAIYVKMLADRASWEYIIQVLTVTALILTIVLSAGTLLAGEVTLIGTIVAAVDLTVATVELGLMYVPECPEKKWFLKYWQPLSIAVGMGSIPILLREGLLKNGPKLMARLNKIKNLADAEKIIEMIKRAYTIVKIEIYVAGKLTFCSFEPFTPALAKLVGQKVMTQMENMGIFLSKELEDGERLLKFGGYEYKGQLNKIKKFLRDAIYKGSNQEEVIGRLKFLIKESLFLSKEGIKLLDDAAELSLTKWGKNARPGVVAIMEGTVKGHFIRVINYSLKKGVQIKRHPLVNYWLSNTDNFTRDGKELMLRVTHGFCGETVNLDEFLYKAEKILGIKEGTMTMEQAQEVLFNSVSHARALKNSKHSLKLHNTYKKACESCNPMLKSFNIKEIKK